MAVECLVLTALGDSIPCGLYAGFEIEFFTVSTLARIVGKQVPDRILEQEQEAEAKSPPFFFLQAIALRITKLERVVLSVLLVQMSEDLLDLLVGKIAAPIPSITLQEGAVVHAWPWVLGYPIYWESIQLNVEQISWCSAKLRALKL